METVQMKYGRESVELDLNGAASVRFLQGESFAAIEDMNAAFKSAVEGENIGGAGLKSRLSAGDKVTIVISDITRFWMRQDRVVSLLVDYLFDIGIGYGDIAILIALGSHRFQSEEELKTLVTPQVFDKVSVTNHDCTAPDLAYAGTTSGGTRVMVNPLATGRKVIVISGTSHHLMSGYSGGRKSILPGISGLATIKQNHIHSLAPKMPKSNPLIGMGQLENNPVSGDMIEAARFVAPIFGINIVVSSGGDICRLIGGDFEAAWEQSCVECQHMMGVPIDRKADVVVVSCGGFPKDMNLYQGCKALINAAQAVRDGGEMVFIASCPEGGGTPAFFSWIEPLRNGNLDAALRENFTIDGYIFYAMCEAMERLDVHMLTEIDPCEIRGMKMKLYKDVRKLSENIDFTGKSVYVMPFGGNTVPYME